MKGFDINELTLNNIGVWPLSFKISIIGLVFILLLVLGYRFDIKPQSEKLFKSRLVEQALKQEFENKYSQTINLETYKDQLRTLQNRFETLVHQLPNHHEVPGLLEDISKIGVANGLEFTFFKPMPEKMYEFYTELPIHISVIGNYHQLAQFISQLANLDRIVLVKNFVIHRIKSPNEGDNHLITDEGKLEMNMTAITYRYNDSKKPVTA